MATIEVHTNGRQAIVTKYHGPTNHRGSRVTASCEAGKVTVPWDHALNSGDNHSAAVHALALKLGWSGKWCGSAVGRGYVFVMLADGYSRFALANPERRAPAK